MAHLPGLKADVYFGDTLQPLPDWRAAMPEDEGADDDAPLTPEERQALVGILGFDPAELEEGGKRRRYRRGRLDRLERSVELLVDLLEPAPAQESQR